jgi:hypothetical protein
MISVASNRLSIAINYALVKEGLKGRPLPGICKKFAKYRLCNASAKLDTEDDAVDSKGEICSVVKSGFRSLAMEIDGMESWSEKVTVESRLMPDFTTETMTPPASLFR